MGLRVRVRCRLLRLDLETIQVKPQTPPVSKVAVCMNVCMHVRTYVGMYACMYVCLHVFMYVCMYVCMDVCKYGSMHVGR